MVININNRYCRVSIAKKMAENKGFLKKIQLFQTLASVKVNTRPLIKNRKIFFAGA